MLIAKADIRIHESSIESCVYKAVEDNNEVTQKPFKSKLYTYVCM